MEKKKRKNESDMNSLNMELKLNEFIKLNEEQMEARRKILENEINFLIGQAGTGKTFLGCYVALEMLIGEKAKKIIITRPTISKEKIGYLPGDINEKLDPWVMPIYNNMAEIIGQNKLEKLVKNKDIQIIPIAFMRGITFSNSVCIVDEAQNTTIEQMLMILTRIGINSKIIATGDLKQIDLANKNECGLKFFSEMKKTDDVNVIELRSNHRSRIVDKILEFYEMKNLEKNKSNKNKHER